MPVTDPAKRIPKSLGTEATLVGTYTLSDLAVALFPGVLVVLTTQVLVPRTLTLGGVSVQTLTLPLAGGAILVGVVFVYLTPAYASSLDWFTTALSFHRRASRRDHEASRAPTQFERLYPGEGALERTDGAFVGVVRVTPPSMALATDAEWTATAEAFADFCNTTVEFPIQLYATTRAFPVETYLETYRERRSDPDVRANPRLAALIDAYLAWYARELDARRMTIRDHYVIVPLTPHEVSFDRDGLLGRLARVPVLGLLVSAWLAPPPEAVRSALLEGLDARLRRVETGLRDLEGCDAQRLDASEAGDLVASFWAGTPRGADDPTRSYRTTPLVGGPE